MSDIYEKVTGGIKTTTERIEATDLLEEQKTSLQAEITRLQARIATINLKLAAKVAAIDNK